MQNEKQLVSRNYLVLIFVTFIEKYKLIALFVNMFVEFFSTIY